jgi:uncharacterized protein (DUF1330 family)
MKKGYWVVAYRSISDESAPKAYAELAMPALQPFGARFLTRRSSKVYPHEAGLQQGTVIVEFDSYEIALAAYEERGLQKGSSGTRLGGRTRLPHCRRGVAASARRIVRKSFPKSVAGHAPKLAPEVV